MNLTNKQLKQIIIEELENLFESTARTIAMDVLKKPVTPEQLKAGQKLSDDEADILDKLQKSPKIMQALEAAVQQAASETNEAIDPNADASGAMTGALVGAGAMMSPAGLAKAAMASTAGAALAGSIGATLAGVGMASAIFATPIAIGMIIDYIKNKKK